MSSSAGSGLAGLPGALGGRLGGNLPAHGSSRTDRTIPEGGLTLREPASQPGHLGPAHLSCYVTQVTTKPPTPICVSSSYRLVRRKAELAGTSPMSR